MEYIVEIGNIANAFFTAYPAAKFPEIERKQGRPYSCLLLEFSNSYICIPFRSHISHNNAYLFKNSVRSKTSRSGLDYSKLLLINDSSYIVVGQAVVDNDEYKEVIQNLPRITQSVEQYISDYKKHILGTAELHPREYQRRYQYSTLPYFHDILFS